MSDEKKIIVDEDWKSQVAAEKEAAEREAKETPPPAAAPPDDAAAADDAASADAKFPQASFELLVTMLATEAMSGLGQFPHPISGKYEADLEQARYAIDMLEILSDKTKGNLTSAEETGMRELLHQLRMTFVAVRTGGSEPAPPPGEG
jgi:hypothetical protein